MNNDYSFSDTAASLVIGWAMSARAPTSATSADSATFVFHEAGYGDFGLTLADGQSSSYETWAAMATISNSTTSSNSTCSSSATNVTATVSNSTYDYIIAGAGPAGIIVAQRLAETGKSVLLIERGGASTAATGGKSVVSWNSSVTQYDVPSMSYYLTTASDTSEYCSQTADMAGCLLGGGTMVNALMFVRPQEADFDDKWPTGWKWTDVSAAADRLYARNPGTTLASKDAQRYDQSVYNTLSSFFDGFGYSHIDAIESPNSKTMAYSYPPWDIQDGLRADPVKSYLPLANALSNFKLTLNTQVIRVVRSGSTMTGVEVESSDGSRQIINLNAGGSVVLAAGTLYTPALLYNTGIGPTDQITTVQNGCVSVNLPDQADWIYLPVGQNLKDHPIFTLNFNTTNATSSMVAANFTSPSLTNIDLFAQQSGPLVQSGQRFNFWTSANTTNGTRYFQGTCSSTAKDTLRIKLYLTHGATSQGSLGITAQGATSYITKPWLTTTADQTAIAEMIDSLLSAARNSSIITPSDSSVTGASLVASSTYTQGDHFVGTAIMGTADDGTAVVDTDTKVYGTDNLFVVDGSIHPDLPTGNTQAIIMVAAEKAAERIIAVGSNSTATLSGGTTTTTTNSTVVAVSSTPSLSSSASPPSATRDLSAGMREMMRMIVIRYLPVVF